MGKILFVASVDEHINCFHLPYLKWFKEHGYDVHVATNGTEKFADADKKFTVPFERSPLKINNFTAYKVLKKIIDQNNYSLIHCHTPVASVITRLAARKARKSGTKVLYTAHGFHFCQGAPLKNWLIFYPIEKWCSRFCDCLITINREDFLFAQKKFSKTNVEYIHGIGIDIDKFLNAKINFKRKEERKKLGIADDDIMLLSVGELNKNKNHQLIIRCLAELNNKKIHYIICGTGSLKKYLKGLIKELKLENNVHLVGYQNQTVNFYHMADIFVFPSRREGLPVSVMEAMSCNIPVVASNIRGCQDLILNDENGFLINVDDCQSWIQAIEKLAIDSNLKSKLIENNLKRISKFSLTKSLQEMQKIYEDFL
ncbi:glycosyltransferase family 4 protein [Lentisphaerota bacterium WC36G]|nr:glycosyltransferase family 4 protein [Lentisphaerae bacterium WC36]